jgi:hypothetical protein
MTNLSKSVCCASSRGVCQLNTQYTLDQFKLQEV